MKEGIHPDYHAVKVHCACGHVFDTRSTIKGQMIRVEVPPLGADEKEN